MSKRKAFELTAMCMLLLISIEMSQIPNVKADFTLGKYRDWDGKKRVLKYKIDGSLTGNWPGWIDEAVKRINDASTGWTLTKVTSGEDILFKMVALDDGKGGGGVVLTWKDQWIYNYATIQLDNDAAKASGGWATSDPASDKKALDPVGVSMHELTHPLRLSHDTDAVDDIEDPEPPGDHTNTLTAKDIDALKKSAAAGLDKRCVVNVVDPPGSDWEESVEYCIGGDIEGFSYSVNNFELLAIASIDAILISIAIYAKRHTKEKATN